MQVLADGWGYTADYHDWAVGLVRDSKNNYLMALPCQQDDRSVSAARLRGTVQRLIPKRLRAPIRAVIDWKPSRPPAFPDGLGHGHYGTIVCDGQSG